jgi:hypothetical protein
MDAFCRAAARRAFQARHSKAFDDGYQQRSDVELRLGEYVGQFSVDDTQLGESDLKVRRSMKEVSPMEDKKIYLLANWFEPSAIGWFAAAIYGAGMLAAADGFFDRRHTMTTANLKEDCHALPAS